MSSFNQEKWKNDGSKWRNELPFSSSVCSLMEPRLWLVTAWSVGMYYEWIATWTNTVVSLDELSKGFTYFCFIKIRYFFCIFHYAIYWMKLERFFSMLAPTQPQLCLLLSSQSKDWGISTYAGTSGYFLFVPSLLPTVMDPSSVIIRLLLFFIYFYKTFSHRHATLDICQVLWILDSFVVPTLVYNKALREGFNVCEHHKCFILPMHRLGCWKERLLYSVPALVCAISHEFLCLPHCCRFLQYPLTSPREGRGMRNHCTDLL